MIDIEGLINNDFLVAHKQHAQIVAAPLLIDLIVVVTVLALIILVILCCTRHDSYLCKVDILMKGSLNLPFPTQRISGKNFTMPNQGTNIIEPVAFLARYIIDYPIWKIVDDSQIRDVLYQKCMKTVSIYSWKEAVKKFCNTGSS